MFGVLPSRLLQDHSPFGEQFYSSVVWMEHVGGELLVKRYRFPQIHYRISP
jgi:hypothetical protein